MRVKIYHMKALLQELESIRPTNSEQLIFQLHVREVAAYIENSGEWHDDDVIVEFE